MAQTLVATLVLSGLTPLEPLGLLILFTLAWPLMATIGAAYGLVTGRTGVSGALVAIPMVLYIPAALLRRSPGTTPSPLESAIIAAVTLTLVVPLAALASAPAFPDQRPAFAGVLKALAAYVALAVGWALLLGLWKVASP